MPDTFEYKGVVYDTTHHSCDTYHGGPFDRGSADSYYHRSSAPHYYPEGTGKGDCITSKNMSQAEIDAYLAGYEYNEIFGDKKVW